TLATGVRLTMGIYLAITRKKAESGPLPVLSSQFLMYSRLCSRKNPSSSMICARPRAFRKEPSISIRTRDSLKASTIIFSLVELVSSLLSLLDLEVAIFFANGITRWYFEVRVRYWYFRV